jgi:phosphatidylglycerol lysyltransferase
VKSALRRATQSPVTISIVVVLLVVWVVALTTGAKGPFAPSFIGVNPGAFAQRQWWALLSSIVDAGTIVQLIIAIIATVVAVGLAERLMGSWRTLVAFVVTGVTASALGVGLVFLGLQLHEFWSTSVHGVITLDPLTPIAGTLAWASAWAGPLWRRRIRTTLIAVSAALLLYSGQPADLYLMVAVGLGIGIGRLTHRPAVREFWTGSRHESRTLLALATAILAVGPVLTLLSATRYGVLSPLGIAVTDATPSGVGHAIGCVAGRVSPGCFDQLGDLRFHSVGGTLVSLLPLVLMLICARGLLAGRRAALVVLVVLLTAESLLSAWYFGVLPASGTRYVIPLAPQRYGELALWLVVSTLVPLVFAILLLTRAKLFPVRAAPSAILRYVVGLVVAVVVPGALYLSVGWALRGGFTPVPNLGEFVVDLPQRFVPIEFIRGEVRDFVPTSLAAHLIWNSIGPLFWLIVVTSTLMLLSHRGRFTREIPDDQGIRRLLAIGSGTLGFMATWPGNRLWTSSSGDFGIAYRVENGVAVTTSDPIGRAGDPDAALAEFFAFCDRSAWTPVFYSVHEEWRTRLVQRGWASLPVAEETTIDPRAFTLDGKVMHDVRYSVNRAAREGVRAVWGSWHELPRRTTAQISALSEQWMSEKDLPELGFTLGGIDEVIDDDVVVGVAVDEHDTVLAVTSWLPVRRDGALVGRTLDFMRRTPGGANGVMEFLIASGLQRLGEEGLELASLSGSPLATPAEGIQNSRALASVLGIISRTLEPVYGFRSLLRFKRKFAPTLDPMYMVYRDPLQLARIGAAIARCYLPTLTVRQATRILGERTRTRSTVPAAHAAPAAAAAPDPTVRPAEKAAVLP